MVRVPDAKSDCSHRGEAEVRILNFKTTWSEFHHLPRVGPKQLCALAHLGCTRAAGTSQLYIFEDSQFTIKYMCQCNLLLHFEQTLWRITCTWHTRESLKTIKTKYAEHDFIPIIIFRSVRISWTASEYIHQCEHCCGTSQGGR